MTAQLERLREREEVHFGSADGVHVDADEVPLVPSCVAPNPCLPNRSSGSAHMVARCDGPEHQAGSVLPI